MNYSQSKVQVGVGSSDACILTSNNVFSIAFSVRATDELTKYTVEHLIGGDVWFPHPEVAAKVGNSYGYYPHPISAIRVTITEGTGAVELSVITASC